MSTNTKENGFEKLITDYLVENNGYILRTSQDKDLFQQKIIKRINDQIKQKGIIQVSRPYL